MLRGAAEFMSQVVLAAGIGLAIGAIMMNVTGYDWKEAYQALWLGSFGDRWGLSDTMADATPLILTGPDVRALFPGRVFQHRLPRSNDRRRADGRGRRLTTGRSA